MSGEEEQTTSATQVNGFILVCLPIGFFFRFSVCFFKFFVQILSVEKFFSMDWPSQTVFFFVRVEQGLN